MAKGKVNDDSNALRGVIVAFESHQKAERALKDERKAGLERQKDALDEVQLAIGEGRSSDPADAPHKLGTVIATWDEYLAAKSEVSTAVKEKRDAVAAAQVVLENAVANAKQGELF